ncbi:MAG: hypothetical protein EP335_06465 [Alphaproteobacteria bacterium]|nr:MAG: hypothetical protein EP335_06465 [Alphaproteobacteria bacterium]
MSDRASHGILQVAFGQKYVEEAIASARTARAHMPDTPLALVTDATTDEADELFDIVRVVPMEKPDIPGKFWGFYNKIVGLEATPFERTLFMDVDIFCAHDVTECFGALERKSMVVVPIPPRDRAHVPFRPGGVAIPHMNTGVLGYNSGTLPDGFFAAWKKLYVKNCPDDAARNFGDQSIFRRLVWDQNVNFLLLDYAYNFRFTKPALFSGPVKLLHGRASNAAFVAQLLNITTEPRIYLPNIALLVMDSKSRDWTLYPYARPSEPVRMGAGELAQALDDLAEDFSTDIEAQALVRTTLGAAGMD